MSIWNCPVCNEENGGYNAYCEYCWIDGNKVYNPDKWYIREIRIRHLVEGAKAMTPQEELFAKLFNEDKALVRDWDTIQLRAKREELVEIIQRAKISVSAIDSTEDERKKARKRAEGPKGFERSLNVDEASSDAINKIKERQKRMSKLELAKAELAKLYETAGHDPNDATKLADAATSNRKIIESIKKDEDKGILRGPTAANSFVVTKPAIELTEAADKPELAKTFVNPFAKKDNQ